MQTECDNIQSQDRIFKDTHVILLAFAINVPASLSNASTKVILFASDVRHCTLTQPPYPNQSGTDTRVIDTDQISPFSSLAVNLIFDRHHEFASSRQTRRKLWRSRSVPAITNVLLAIVTAWMNYLELPYEPVLEIRLISLGHVVWSVERCFRCGASSSECDAS